MAEVATDPVGRRGGGNLTVLTAPGLTSAEGRASVRVQACGFVPGTTSTCVYVARSISLAVAAIASCRRSSSLTPRSSASCSVSAPRSRR